MQIGPAVKPTRSHLLRFVGRELEGRPAVQRHAVDLDIKSLSVYMRLGTPSRCSFPATLPALAAISIASGAPHGHHPTHERRTPAWRSNGSRDPLEHRVFNPSFHRLLFPHVPHLACDLRKHSGGSRIERATHRSRISPLRINISDSTERRRLARRSHHEPFRDRRTESQRGTRRRPAHSTRKASQRRRKTKTHHHPRDSPKSRIQRCNKNPRCTKKGRNCQRYLRSWQRRGLLTLQH
ncbi:MAG: hypothetical protein JWR15_2960 [Prosthecobacter sp.]|nr:hypothetical protein [Prosthecobacter sp.]